VPRTLRVKSSLLVSRGGTMIKRLISIGLGTLVVAISAPASLFAQASSYGSSGGSGSFGSSSAFGSASAFGSTSGAFGSTSGSTTGGMNSANGMNQGPVGMGGGGMYGASGYGAQNGVRPGGSSYSSGSSQYGSRSSGQGQYGAGQGQGRGGGGSRRSGGTQGQGQYGQGQGGAGTNKDAQPWYEPRIEVGFTVATPAPTAVQTNIAAPLHTPAMTSRFGTVNVSVQGSTVTLRGTVNSEEDRQLAAQMAMLEPAVMSVQNDLKIAAPPTGPAPMPPR